MDIHTHACSDSHRQHTLAGMQVRVYGFGVDELATRRAKYNYFDDYKGAHNAHSFASQSRFLKLLARSSGRVTLCVPDHATPECNGTSNTGRSRAAQRPSSGVGRLFAEWPGARSASSAAHLPGRPAPKTS